MNLHMKIKAIGIKSIILGLPAAVLSFYASIFWLGSAVVLILSILAIILGITGIIEGQKHKHRDTVIYSIVGLILGLIPYMVTLMPGRNWLTLFF